MTSSNPPTGILCRVIAALMLPLAAASSVQANPPPTGAHPAAITWSSAVAPSPTARPDASDPAAQRLARAEGLPDFVNGAGSIAFFSSLARAAGLGNVLDFAGAYTLFVPVDGAFSALSGQQISDLIHDPESLRSLVAAHIVRGRVLATDLTQGNAIFSISGARIEPSPAARPQVNGATLVKTVRTGPVVVHVVDGLLQGPGPNGA
jgi:uncharacterized surface protein with fasciclin (FAS1) repeats